MDSDLREPLLNNISDEEQCKDRRPSNEDYPSTSIKAIIFGGLLIAIFIANYCTFLNPLPQGQCYYDRMFDYTFPLNNFLALNPTYRNILLIVTSFLADVLIILTILLWCYKLTDSVFVIATLVFYLFRFTLMEIFILDFPTNYLFIYPGLKSLFVSYLPTNDFFFSGHTGFPVIVYIEFLRYKDSPIPPLALVTLVFQFMTMLLLEGHYTIDLVIGCFSAWYLYRKTVKVLLFLNS